MLRSLVSSAVVLGVLLPLVLLGSGCPGDSGIVVLADKGLENAIRAELRKPFGFLTEADMLSLTSLTGRNLSIRDLKGIEMAENLLSLDLSQNRIEDVGELATLTRLRYLNLDDNALHDISPLAGLFLLEGLSLCNSGSGDFQNQISDISALVLNAKHVEVGGGLGEGIGEGDYVKIGEAGLSQVALEQDVPLLRDFYLVDMILTDESGNPIQTN